MYGWREFFPTLFALDLSFFELHILGLSTSRFEQFTFLIGSQWYGKVWFLVHGMVGFMVHSMVGFMVHGMVGFMVHGMVGFMLHVTFSDPAI